MARASALANPRAFEQIIVTVWEQSGQSLATATNLAHTLLCVYNTVQDVAITSEEVSEDAAADMLSAFSELEGGNRATVNDFIGSSAQEAPHFVAVAAPRDWTPTEQVIAIHLAQPALDLDIADYVHKALCKLAAAQRNDAAASFGSDSAMGSMLSALEQIVPAR